MNPIEALTTACELARKQVALAVNNPGAPTPCSEFNAAQLVGHMIAAVDGNSSIFGGQSDGLNPFDPPTYPADEFVSRFDKATTNLLAAVSVEGKMDEMVAHPASPEPMPAAAAMAFPTFDMYVHSWDLAQANDDPGEFPAELHEIVNGFCQQAFAGERAPGIVDPAVPAPEGATPIQELAAFLGRS